MRYLSVFSLLLVSLTPAVGHSLRGTRSTVLLSELLRASVARDEAGPLSQETQGDERERPRQAAFLGVEVERVEGLGLVAIRVVPGSAAERAGMRAEDRLIGVAGRATDTADDVRGILCGYAAGDRVQLVFRHGVELHVVEAALGARSAVDVEKRADRTARVLEVLGAGPGEVVADIGCGGGWLSQALAELVGEGGLVYAVEIDESAVERMAQRGIPNVETVHSKPDDVSLPDRSLDKAVLYDVASHVEKAGRPRFYASLARALKDDGRLFLFGPHGKARETLDELAEFGFRAVEESALAELSGPELDGRLEQGIAFVHH